MARDWTKPPPDALFTMRVPVEYASLHAAVCESFVATFRILTPYSVWCQGHTSMFVNVYLPSGRSSLNFSQLTSEDSYQIATMGVQGLRVEIVSDGPPPEEEPECVLSPVRNSYIRVTQFLELRRKLRPLHLGWYQDR